MTNITELGAYFPGSRKDKRIIKLDMNRNQTTIYYEDGSELTLVEPCQVQDFPVPERLVKPWFKKLRDVDTSITRYSYRERSYLQKILEETI